MDYQFQVNGRIAVVVAAPTPLTGQTGAIANFINYTPPAVAGVYRLTAYCRVTAWITPASFQLKFAYQPLSGSVQSGDIMLLSLAGGTSGNAVNAVDIFYGLAVLLPIDNSGTVITLSTVGTFTGSPVYTLAGILENLA